MATHSLHFAAKAINALRRLSTTACAATMATIAHAGDVEERRATRTTLTSKAQRRLHQRPVSRKIRLPGSKKRPRTTDGESSAVDACVCVRARGATQCASTSQCDDLNACTSKVCDNATCLYTTKAPGASCSDADTMLVNELCSATGFCVGELPTDGDGDGGGTSATAAPSSAPPSTAAIVSASGAVAGVFTVPVIVGCVSGGGGWQQQ